MPIDDAQPDSPAAPGAVVWVIRLLALVALGAAAMTLRATLSPDNAPPGCGGTSGCAQVLNTRWAYWFGQPVSAMGMIVYAGLIVSSVHIQSSRDAARRRAGWRLILALSTLAGFSAVYFLVIELAVVKAVCVYCTTAHIAAIALAVVVYLKAPSMPRSSWAGLGVIAVAGLAVLVAGQLLGEQPTHDIVPSPPSEGPVTLGGTPDIDTGRGQERTISVLHGQARLRPTEHPHLGNTDAQTLAVYLFDYTCPHCRRMHAMLKEAMTSLGPDALGLVTLPTPLDSDCNPDIAQTSPENEHACTYARLALAVFYADPREYQAFDDYLMTGERPPSPEEARRKAIELVGEDALKRAEGEGFANLRIARYLALYQLTRQYRLPMVIIGGNILRGRPATTGELIAALKDLGVGHAKLDSTSKNIIP
ncbi:MAG: hypothetical protein GC164_14330 [Phycisphaera sp.]|nr:hypothetical protein [Phycisphaera sp.]